MAQWGATAIKTGVWESVVIIKSGRWPTPKAVTGFVRISTPLPSNTISSLTKTFTDATQPARPLIIRRTSKWATWKREKSTMSLIIDPNYPYLLLLINCLSKVSGDLFSPTSTSWPFNDNPGRVVMAAQLESNGEEPRSYAGWWSAAELWNNVRRVCLTFVARITMMLAIVAFAKIVASYLCEFITCLKIN